MPLELIADRPGHAILSEYKESSLAADEVRVKSLFSSVKHGTFAPIPPMLPTAGTARCACTAAASPAETPFSAISGICAWGSSPSRAPTSIA